MSSIRTQYRRKRRDLIKDISFLLFDINNLSDNHIEKISLRFLTNVKIDLQKILNTFSLDDGYVGGIHISPNDGDAMDKISKKN